MTEQRNKTHDWDRSQWAGGTTAKDRNMTMDPDADPHGSATEPAAEPRWNKSEWVGDQGRGSRPAPQAPEDMPEGEPGLSGSRHNPGVQHWAPDHPKKDRQGK